MKKVLSILFVFVSMFFLQACNDDKGNDFIGEWVQVENVQYPSYILIRKEDGVFFVDVKKFDLSKAEKKHSEDTIDYMTGKSKNLPSDDVAANCGNDCYRVTKLEAVAASKSVLKGDAISLRLESGVLYFDSEAYKLVKR
ncbi:hypothetical protein RHT52_004638 [Salmonella enterica]|nr:hypothetical protein [Salmonella enterica]